MNDFGKALKMETKCVHIKATETPRLKVSMSIKKSSFALVFVCLFVYLNPGFDGYKQCIANVKFVH